MTEQKFQKAVLDSLKTLNKKVDSLDTKVDSLDTKVDSLDTKVNSLDTKVNALTDRVTTLEVCMEDQFAEQQVFAEKLAVVIENQIVDRLSVENDKFKGYTDKKVHTHEVKFRHEVVA